jgi:acetate---CoA ligase (ADP-forming)
MTTTTEETRGRRFGHERLGRLFAAESIAVVGASDRSAWSHMVFDNFDAWGYGGRLHPVNRRGASVRGVESATSCAEIGEPIDLAILLVGNAVVPDALRDAAAAGAGGAVVLGAGFGEAGDEGKAAQRELEELARELDVALIGPNGVGFASLLDRVPAWVSPPPPLLPGRVGVVSQSGNLGLTISNFAVRQAIGISHIVSTGNEVNVDIVDVIDYLVRDDRVAVIAVFAETIRDPAGFLRAAEDAAAAGKPIVALKAGSSSLAAAVAETHTGALVGDDAVVEAAFRSVGVVRVTSIEQLAITAGLLEHTGRLPAGGVGIVSISGGSDDIIADRAEEIGLDLPALSPATEERVRESVAEIGVTRVMNPFDITGAAVGNFGTITEPLRAIGEDPNIALVAWTGVPFTASPPMIDSYPSVAKGLRAAGRRGVLLLNTSEPIDGVDRETLIANDMPYTLAGIDRGVVAMRDAIAWSGWIRGREGQAGALGDAALERPADATGAWGEARSLELIAEHGVPVVPWRLVGSEDEAVEAAAELGYPVVVKVSGADILHKSERGGVALDLGDADGVRGAYAAVTAAGGDAIVAPMRPPGLELIVGVVRDEAWGPVLAVGLGGIHTEVLRDTALRLLPVAPPEIEAMLGELRGSALLDGFRGAPAADRAAVVAAIDAFATLATGLADDLTSIEVNPLYVHDETVEALDAAIQWRA